MAQPRGANPTAFGGFPTGINNTGVETDMPKDQWGNTTGLRDAVNVDILPDGKTKRRDGYSRVVSAALGHSAWSDSYLSWGLFVDDNYLCVMHEDETIDVLRSDMAKGLPVSYARINDGVWYSNGAQSGIITLDLEQLPWNAGQPAGAPTLTPTVGGQLTRGTYQVTLTFLDGAGRESGAPLAAMVDVADGGAIYCENIQQPPPGGRVRIYMSSGNDGVLRAAVTLSEGTTDVLLVQHAEGRVCDTHLLAGMPAGQLVAYGNGRLFVARGRELLFSPPLRYGLFDPRAGRISFVERITMIAFVGDGTDGAGLYVSDAKRTYWFAGRDPSQWSQVIASPTPALPGHIAWATGTVFGLNSDAPVPCWHNTGGRLCVGAPGGNVVMPQPRDGMPDAAWDTGDSAALHFIERPGDNRIVSSLQGARASSLAVQDRLVVREYRHSTQP